MLRGVSANTTGSLSNKFARSNLSSIEEGIESSLGNRGSSATGVSFCSVHSNMYLVRFETLLAFPPQDFGCVSFEQASFVDVTVCTSVCVMSMFVSCVWGKSADLMFHH